MGTNNTLSKIVNSDLEHAAKTDSDKKQVIKMYNKIEIERVPLVKMHKLLIYR